ncbi:CNT_HP2_G0018470.mRNA.1.CDS.1 [Saccharomyces cerevisiae]|nr:CNT_HP2_G0018470.mRNA.1.CDS.1 [Saccharomyces cerevisiae]CAI6538427.1 CNT_HP2_G0018470.mRNA.1.CDS.1 [Saccharomyces cerevisiae]
MYFLTNAKPYGELPSCTCKTVTQHVIGRTPCIYILSRWLTCPVVLHWYSSVNTIDATWSRPNYFKKTVPAHYVDIYDVVTTTDLGDKPNSEQISVPKSRPPHHPR